MSNTYTFRYNYGIILVLAVVTMLFSYTKPLYAVEHIEEKQLEDLDLSDDEEVAPVEAERYGMVRAGYRFLNSDSSGFAANPYSKLSSSTIMGLSAGTLGADLKLSVAATFIQEDDYHAELLFDGGDSYRFHLESQALWHNLLSETLPPATPGFINVKNLYPIPDYGLRVSTNQADAKVRIGNNPLHLTLGYWELHREGNTQTRFSDFWFSGGGNTLISTVSKKDQTTREGTIGVDGQLGSLGVAYLFRIRDFSEQSPLNRYNFTNAAAGANIPGSQAFLVTPDNQVVSHTIKLYSDMSGGLTGTAAYTYLQRENNGNDGDVHKSSAPSDTIQVASADFRYTPFKELSFALKYRHQEIDRESPYAITTPFASIPTVGTIPETMTLTPGLLLVHPSSDSIRDTLVWSGTYQPRSTTQLRFEYRADLESRYNLQSGLTPNDPLLKESDSRQTHTGKMTAFWKPLNGVKLTTLYSYADCNNPGYASSFSNQHLGQFFATLNRSNKWGAMASYLGRYETSDNGAVITTTKAKISLPRENLNQSLNASLWFAPIERLTITTSYSYLSNDSEQAVLFSNVTADSLAATNYKAIAHLYAVDAVYVFSEHLDIGTSFQLVRSNSRFVVGATQYSNNETIPTIYTTQGIQGLTALDTTETAVSVRADWHITSNYGLSMEYDFRNYNSGNNLLDGSTHSIMTLVTGHW